jgi:AraC-like DNA-binding protein
MEDPKLQTIPNVLIKLAELLGTEVKSRRLAIPEKYGKGYCTGFVFNEHIRMLISNYILNEDVIVENQEINASKKTIFFKFQNIFPEIKTELSVKNLMGMPSVLIATSRMNTDEVISIHTNTSTINIEIDADYLSGLLDFRGESPLLESLLQNAQPLLFEQMVFPSLQKIVDEIINQTVGVTFELFFLRIKAEELLCQLLMELEKRDERRLYALNICDIQAIYKVKEQIFVNLGKPPVIKELSIIANMSPTKLKVLFKQIFGNSIFNYYQEFRMKEAARLLKENKLSVSDVGYQMGFTNLSHFSRVFEEHIGMKPKQYSRFSFN